MLALAPTGAGVGEMRVALTCYFCKKKLFHFNFSLKIGEGRREFTACVCVLVKKNYIFIKNFQKPVLLMPASPCCSPDVEKLGVALIKPVEQTHPNLYEK